MVRGMGLREEIDSLIGNRFKTTTVGLSALTEGPQQVAPERTQEMQLAVAVRGQILELAEELEGLLAKL